MPSGLPASGAIPRLCGHKVMILLIQVKFVQARGPSLYYAWAYGGSISINIRDLMIRGACLDAASRTHSRAYSFALRHPRSVIWATPTDTSFWVFRFCL